jgi:hypothetical protein
MAKILAFEAPGATVAIAVRGPGESISAVGVVDDVIVKVNASMNEVFSMVTAIGESAQASLTKSANPPESAEIELGLQFTAKGTVYVVESQGSATIKVKLTYKFKP